MGIKIIKMQKNQNRVFIGIRPVMNYVNETQMKFKEKDTIVLCARGRFISKAIDVLEIIKRTIEIELEIISTTTETFEKDNKKISVSAIQIKIKKKDL